MAFRAGFFPFVAEGKIIVPQCVTRKFQLVQVVKRELGSRHSVFAKGESEGHQHLRDGDAAVDLKLTKIAFLPAPEAKLNSFSTPHNLLICISAANQSPDPCTNPGPISYQLRGLL